jgi:replicative DNA helicase
MAESEVFRIHEGRMREGGPEAVVPLLTRAVKRIEALYASRNPITGLPTGFEDLDRRTAGLQSAELIIVAGRPSMGKSSLMMNMAEHALMTDLPGAVLVFSMEMPSDQLVMRMLSSLGRIDQTRMRTGDMHDDDWPRFTSAVSQLKDKSLYIDDSPALTPNDVRTRARRVQREAGGLKLVAIDYLQLMRPNRELDNNRVGEISEISRALKSLAKELSCPVIALSQLNRGVESRNDKRPLMSDLRESGAIEQDADLILFIYRDEVYNPESPDKGVAEVIIGKQRNGPIGKVKLAFIGNLTKFEDLAPNHYAESMH